MNRERAQPRRRCFPLAEGSRTLPALLLLALFLAAGRPATGGTAVQVTQEAPAPPPVPPASEGFASPQDSAALPGTADPPPGEEVAAGAEDPAGKDGAGGGGESGEKAPGDTDPATAAWERFTAAAPEIQLEVLAEIRRRVDAADGEDLAAVRALRDRAAAEIEVKPQEAPSFHDPEVYARGLVTREFLARDSARNKRNIEAYDAYDSYPPFLATVRYDFGSNEVVALGYGVPPDQELADLLFGYLPGSDLALAWIEKQLDWDRSLDPIAAHFGHAYCTLAGACDPIVTLYDAFASGRKVDMPDVDVIAFAREVMHKRSYVSPLAAGPRRQRLYAEIRRGFLRLFRHRTMVEAAGNLWLNPDAPLRPEHEPLRARILHAFALDGGDVGRLRRRLRRAKDRDGFVDAMDGLARRDAHWEEKASAWAEARRQTRWKISRLAMEVLREWGLAGEGGGG